MIDGKSVGQWYTTMALRKYRTPYDYISGYENSFNSNPNTYFSLGQWKAGVEILFYGITEADSNNIPISDRVPSVIYSIPFCYPSSTANNSDLSVDLEFVVTKGKVYANGTTVFVRAIDKNNNIANNSAVQVVLVDNDYVE